jgi:hypothetical protein
MNYSGAQLRFRVSSILRTGVQYKIITKSTQFKYRTRVFYDFEHKCVGRYPVKGRERNRIEREAGARNARVRLRSTCSVAAGDKAQNARTASHYTRIVHSHSHANPPLFQHAGRCCKHSMRVVCTYFATRERRRVELTAPALNAL